MWARAAVVESRRRRRVTDDGPERPLMRRTRSTGRKCEGATKRVRLLPRTPHDHSGPTTSRLNRARRMSPTATSAKSALSPKQATERPCPPPGLTAAAVANAKGAELRHWIEQANQQAAGGKRVLRKTGCNDELRKRLAQYYELGQLGSGPAPQATCDAPVAPAAHSPSGNPAPAPSMQTFNDANGSTCSPSVMNGQLLGILSGSVNCQVCFPFNL